VRGASGTRLPYFSTFESFSCVNCQFSLSGGAHADCWEVIPSSDKRTFLQAVIHRVTVHETEIEILIRRKQLHNTLLGISPASNGSRASQALLRLMVKASVMRSGGEVRLITLPSSETTRACPALVKAVVRARDWYERLVSGELTGRTTIARSEKLDERYVSRILECAYLAPDIIERILDGQHPPGLSLIGLLRHMPLDWQEQRFGFK